MVPGGADPGEPTPRATHGESLSHSTRTGEPKWGTDPYESWNDSRRECRKGNRKRTVLMVLGALLFALPLHGQQTVSDANGTAVQEGTRSDQPIPPAVMKELEAMKARIAQLEAQLQERDGQQGPVSAVEGSEAVSKGPNVPEVRLASVSLAQPSLAQPQSGTEAALPAANNPETKPAEPFAFADWTWLNGNARTKEAAFDIHPRWPKSPACFRVDAGSPQGREPAELGYTGQVLIVTKS